MFPNIFHRYKYRFITPLPYPHSVDIIMNSSRSLLLIIFLLSSFRCFFVVSSLERRHVDEGCKPSKPTWGVPLVQQRQQTTTTTTTPGCYATRELLPSVKLPPTLVDIRGPASLLIHIRFRARIAFRLDANNVWRRSSLVPVIGRNWEVEFVPGTLLVLLDAHWQRAIVFKCWGRRSSSTTTMLPVSSPTTAVRSTLRTSSSTTTAVVWSTVTTPLQSSSTVLTTTAAAPSSTLSQTSTSLVPTTAVSSTPSSTLSQSSTSFLPTTTPDASSTVTTPLPSSTLSTSNAPTTTESPRTESVMWIVTASVVVVGILLLLLLLGLWRRMERRGYLCLRRTADDDMEMVVTNMMATTEL